MNRSLRRTRLFGFLGVAAVAYALVAFVLVPRFAEPAALQTKIANAKATVQTLTNTLTELKAQQGNMALAQQQMTKFITRYPATAAWDELQVSVNNAADKSGLGANHVLNVSAFTPTAVASDKQIPNNPEPLPASATSTKTNVFTNKTSTPTAAPATTGSATQASLYQMNVEIAATAATRAPLIAFVKQLAQMDRAFAVDHVKISSANDGSSGGGLWQQLFHWSNGTSASSQWKLVVDGRAFILKANTGN